MACEDKLACIVLLAEEFEGGGVFEGVDAVGFREADRVRAFEGVEVGQEGCEEGGGAGVAEEEGRFGILRHLRFAGCEGALGAGGFGFAVLYTSVFGKKKTHFLSMMNCCAK